MRLTAKTLGELPDGVRGPSYNRSGLTSGIVHIGVGNFHRAHQAWYLHRLFDMGLNHDWAIIGAGVRPSDAGQRSKLLAQDCLTTLIELDPSHTSAEVVGSMIDYLPVEEGNGPLIARMADPSIRIVALTVKHGNWPVHEKVQAARDLESWDEAICERAVLRELRGGCSTCTPSLRTSRMAKARSTTPSGLSRNRPSTPRKPFGLVNAS